MKCYTPMIRIYQEADRETKKQIKDNGYTLEQHIIPREEVLKRLKHNENIYTGLKRINKENEKNNIKWRYQTIPCRHCYACSLNYAAEWATRIMLECKGTENNYFITLTYDDENLPILSEINKGEWKFENDGTWITGSVLKEDSQKFIKRLRRNLERNNKLDPDFKFFLAAEYGETTARPHYHAILMHCNLDIGQLYDCHIDENFKPHWKSKELEKLWGKGMVDVAECEWSAAAYVARYCSKKWNKQADDLEYITQGKLPEYVAMSKNIGKKYYDKHKADIYETDKIIMRTFKDGAGNYKPPKAFDRLLEKENPELYDQIKEKRNEAAEWATVMSKKVNHYTDKDLQLHNAETTIQKAHFLKREL